MHPNKRRVLDNLVNWRWRINNLYKIKTKEGKTVVFKENNIQKQINDCTDPKVMILKARQFGVSTNSIIKLFDRTIFNRNQTTCILAHENDALKKLFGIVKFAYETMDEFYKPILDKGGGSMYEMRFPAINSKIYVDLESRSETIQNLHISEAAFIKEQSRIDATTQAVPLTGNISMETTPNGMNHFYDKWIDKDSTYKRLFFPWYVFPEYRICCRLGSPFSIEETDLITTAKKQYNVDISKEQIAFRRIKMNELKHIFSQEYPEDSISCFLSSGNPFFDLSIVKSRLANIPASNHNELQIYEECNPHKNYVCGADTAEGIGGDYCTAAIYCVESRKQVATLRGQFKPSDFALRLQQLCSLYVNGQRVYPTLAVERNNHGHAVLLELGEHLRYPCLYHADDGRAGFVTNSVTKPIMLNCFKDFIEMSPDKINDDVTLQEALTYINENGKLGAVSGKHDDMIIANALAIQMLIKESARTSMVNVNEIIYTEAGNSETMF